jgi:protocatechuate 3,4-dioxygenase alpha subunit
VSFLTTPSQTVGPYFTIGLDHLNCDHLAVPGGSGVAVSIAGQVRDGNGAGVSDAVLEIWQAGSSGRYAHPEDRRELPLDPGWRGFGRIPTDAKGCFQFTTVKPGPVPGPKDSMQAPHIVVLLGMRGLLRHLMTRIYFPDDGANATDPVLALVPAPRRATLIARPEGGGHLVWNILLQGKDETVFFNY